MHLSETKLGENSKRNEVMITVEEKGVTTHLCNINAAQRKEQEMVLGLNPNKFEAT
jgi:hypothetical protein